MIFLKLLLPIALVFTSVNAQAESILQLSQTQSPTHKIRYNFEVCNLDNNLCEVVGRDFGYDLISLRRLSGFAHKYLGSPTLLLTETVLGFGASFLAGSIFIPTATAATVTALLYGGTAGGAIAPNYIPDSSTFRKISPAYHWRKGEMKMLIEKSAEFLDASESDTLILFKLSDFEDEDDYFDALNIVDRILISL